MIYLRLDPTARRELLAELAAMPAFLETAFAALDAEQTTLRGPQGLFSPVEQVWHLADLEREGFAARIDRLYREAEPQLPDFDGTAWAAARNYRSLSLAAGLRAFASARTDNIEKLRKLPEDAWARSGTQAGVGKVSLCDIPSMIQQHDAAHRREIAHWLESAGHLA